MPVGHNIKWLVGCNLSGIRGIFWNSKLKNQELTRASNSEYKPGEPGSRANIDNTEGNIINIIISRSALAAATRKVRAFKGRDEGEGILDVARHHLGLLRHGREIHPLVPFEEGADVEGDLLLLSWGKGSETACCCSSGGGGG